MNNTPENTPRSPGKPDHGSARQGGRRTRPWLIVAPLLWAAVMAVAVPSLEAPRYGHPRQPIEFQIITTIITALAFFGLSRSVSGLRHLLVAPLWAALLLMEYMAWIWPR